MNCNHLVGDPKTTLVDEPHGFAARYPLYCTVCGGHFRLDKIDESPQPKAAQEPPKETITIVPSGRIDYCVECDAEHGYDCPKENHPKETIWEELNLLLNEYATNSYHGEGAYEAAEDIKKHITTTIQREVERERKDVATEICHFLDRMELTDENKSTEQWRNYKRLRNGIRDTYGLQRKSERSDDPTHTQR